MKFRSLPLCLFWILGLTFEGQSQTGPLLGLGAREKGSTYRQSFKAMGTLVEITIYGLLESEESLACSKAVDEVTRVEKLLSFYDPQSELCGLNRGAGKGWQSVSPEMFAVLKEADQAWKDTQGGYDPSVGPLVKLWKRTIREGLLPTEQELTQARSCCGWSRIRLKQTPDGGAIEMPEGFLLDLGGVAKGYGVDRAAQILREAGVTRGLVNAGGDLLAWGHPDGRREYVIGVQHPREASEVLAGVIRCKDRAVVTSGDYEQWTIIEGQRYTHVIDPNTGRSSSGVASVTVSAMTAARADALATGLMAVGPESATEAIGRISDAEVLIMLEEPAPPLCVWASPGLIRHWYPSNPKFKARKLLALQKVE